jgi:hypothetical protein
MVERQIAPKIVEVCHGIFEYVLWPSFVQFFNHRLFIQHTTQATSTEAATVLLDTSVFVLTHSKDIAQC